MSKRAAVVLSWSEAPWTVKWLPVLLAAIIGAGQLIQGLDTWVILRSALFNGVLIYGLLKKFRFAWGVLLFSAALSGFALLGVVTGAAGNGPNRGWQVAILGLLLIVEFFLLLHPLTRAWVGPRGEPPAERLRKLAHPEESSTSP